ncbi:hypothetical protein BGX27_009831 [Mortierella sp. AM989]|nr:hypothetical protein BGX27_009831 [Mortierella sp. AM989]
MSKDLTKFFVTAPEGVLDAPFFYQYDVNSKTWTAEKAPLAQASIWSNRKEAYMLTDTTSGDIWYIGGSVNGVEINEIDKYISGSWNANIAVTNPDSGLGEGTGAVATFAKVSSGTAHLINGKIYMFGGFTSMGGSKTYLNFQNLPWIDTTTRTPTIGTQLTLGTVPPPRQNHCSVLTESKKVIIYGGYDPNTRTTFQDIWSLDLINLTWQLIVPVNVSTPRYGHTCNIVGANMIVLAGRASGKEGNKDIAYGTDIQVYDVMESMWMRSYSYKKDTTPITTLVPPSGGSSKSSGGLGAGAIAGIVIGVLLVAGCAAGFVFYRKRQRRIKTQEAELEKEAYLASLAPEKVANGRNGSRTNERRRRQKSQRNTQYPDSVVIPRSGSTRRLNGSGMATGSPGASHYGFSGVESQSGREDENYSLTTSEAPGNVQYLMQQLPDGSIAVQPVYFNHQPFQLQHSPNMAYSETSSLGGIIRTPLAPSPTLTARTRDANGGGVGEFVAPPLPPSVHSPRDSSASEITSLGRNFLRGN